MPGGIIRYVPMHPPADGAERTSSAANWSIDFDELEKAFNEKTKMIVLNSPHNPVGKVFSKEELRRIGDLCLKHEVIILSDEVYDRLYYVPFTRIATLSPELAKMTLTVGSAGKNFYATAGVSVLDRPSRADQIRGRRAHENLLLERLALAGSRGDWLRDGRQTRLLGHTDHRNEGQDGSVLPSLRRVGDSLLRAEGGYFVLANLAKVKLPEGYEFPAHVKDRPRISK